MLNTYMELNWIHYPQEKYIECVINEDLHYRTYNGGNLILKYFQGDIVELQFNPDNDPWETEKHWLSEQFPELGTYEPIDMPDEEHDAWMLTNKWTKAFPSFGISQNGDYLDRLQRLGSFQTFEGFETVIHNQEHKISILEDSEGNFWKREWCDYQDDFYNQQPCCVFPDNPGLKSITIDEVVELKGQFS